MKITPEELGLQIRNFIQENFIFNGQTLDHDTSLIGSGTIDSTGIIDVISFLEQTFNVQFEDDELIAENFNSVSKIQAFMVRKMTAAGA